MSRTNHTTRKASRSSVFHFFSFFSFFLLIWLNAQFCSRFQHTSSSSLFRLCEGHLQYIIGRDSVSGWNRPTKKKCAEQNTKKAAATTMDWRINLSITVKPQTSNSSSRQHMIHSLYLWCPAGRLASRLRRPSRTSAWCFDVEVGSFLGMVHGFVYIIKYRETWNNIARVNEIMAHNDSMDSPLNG